MEDYETFVLRRLSQLGKSGEEDEEQLPPSSSSSVIRFHGRPILPPLLSRKRREEMQHHRDELQKAPARRKLRVDSRMAYVQSILHSVQLRKTPTLDELLQESEVTTSSLSSHNTSNDSVPQSNVFVGTKASLSPPPASKDNSGFCLSSTTYSAFLDRDRTTQQTRREGCLIDQLDSQQESQPSSFNGAGHQSLSSGYVTYENVENSTSVSGGIDVAGESRGLGSSQGFLNTGGFFHHNTSSTIAKVPDIISHPPVDGEELERSGLQVSFGSDLLGGKDASSTSFQGDLIICEYSPAEKAESSCLDSVQLEVDDPPASTPNQVGEEHPHQEKESVAPSEKSDIADNPDVSQTVNDRHLSPGEVQMEHNSKDGQPDSTPSQESHRVSLQALLKKFQEYRRSQRMLRNRAKNTKIQERAQELPRAKTEEQSLSDKENEEFPRKVSATAEGKRTKERRGTFTLETSANRSWENKKLIEDEIIFKKMSDESEGKCFTADGIANELTSVEKEKTFQNNQLNSSQEITTGPKQSSVFIQKPAETFHSPDTFYLTTCSTAFHKGPRKHRSVPAPVFCKSPTGFKSKSSISDGQAAGGRTSETPSSPGLNEDLMEGSHLGHSNRHAAASPTAKLVVRDDVTSVLAKSSLHIDELESNISILKVLISDLESTVKEDLDHRCQTEGNPPSESSFLGRRQFELIANNQHTLQVQREGEYWEDKDDTEYYECPKRPLFNNSESMHGPAEAGTVNEPSPGENSSTDHRAAEAMVKKQPAKWIFSAAQRMLVPHMFRSAPSEPKPARDLSVHSDTSRHSAERSDEPAAIDDPHFSRSPSLNQSYDVDTPSDLWLHQGSGSDTGSQSHLTPESQGGGQDGGSKVKRRLLMHQTEENQDTSRGGGSVVSPSCSTPRAAVLCCEPHDGLRDKQEQLKQVHAAQVRALQDEHKRQQEELLQALAVRFRLLQSVSFPCSMSNSRLGDKLTFPTPSQLSSPLSQRYRPLLAAAAKGFLARRLLRTERVAQLARTIRDTRQFLQAFQQQLSPDRQLCSRQDLLLQERVALQLRAARYEVHDIFFSLSAREQMQLIGWDRELTRERGLRRQSGQADHPGGKGKSSLSAATQKSLERKRGALIQRKAAERQRRVPTRTRQKTGLSPEQPPETKQGQLRANPQRVPKSTTSSRPR